MLACCFLHVPVGMLLFSPFIGQFSRGEALQGQSLGEESEESAGVAPEGAALMQKSESVEEVEEEEEPSK